MLDAAVLSTLKAEGPAAFVTTGPSGPHLVATWQSYLEVLDGSRLAFPAAPRGYLTTEANLAAGSTCQMVVGSRADLQGFRLTGTAELQTDTPVHRHLQERFPWCRAAVVFKVGKVERILGD